MGVDAGCGAEANKFGICWADAAGCWPELADACAEGRVAPALADACGMAGLASLSSCVGIGTLGGGFAWARGWGTNLICGRGGEAGMQVGCLRTGADAA